MKKVSVLMIVAVLGVSFAVYGLAKLEMTDAVANHLPNIFESEPNDTCATADSMWKCDDMEATIDSADWDWFKFYATAGTGYIIETSARNEPNDVYDTQIWLTADCPNSSPPSMYIEYDDDGSIGFYSLIEWWNCPISGIYYIAVRSYNHKYTGDYYLFITDGSCNPCNDAAYEPSNNDYTGARPLFCDRDSLIATLSPSTDIDWYTFTLTTSPNVSAWTGPCDFSFTDTRMWIYDSTLNEVYYNDNGTPYGDPFSGDIYPCETQGLPLSAGSYYIKIEPVDSSTGGYTIWLDCCDTSSCPPDSPEGVLYCDFDSICAHIYPGGDHDYYQFDGMAGQVVSFYTAPCSTDNGDTVCTDTRLGLLDNNCMSLQLNDDGGPYGAYPCYMSGIMSSILPYTGTYYLKVYGDSSFTTGPYTMVLNCTLEDSLIVACDDSYPANDTVHLPVYARVKEKAGQGLTGINLMFFWDSMGVDITSIEWDGPSIGEANTAINDYIGSPVIWIMDDVCDDGSCRGGVSVLSSSTAPSIPSGHHLLCWLVVATGTEGIYQIEPRNGIGNPPLTNNYSYFLTQSYPGLVGCDVAVLPVLVENEELSSLPDEYSLGQNYPNPFNPISEIKYDLPKNSHVRLEIYNILGQRVATLVDEHQKAGYKSVHWDSRSQTGNEVPSGIYFYHLQAGDFVETRKMILLR